MASSSSEEGNVIAHDLEELKKSVVEYGSELLKPSGSVDELLKKLDNLDQVLSCTIQDLKVHFEEAIIPLKDALIADEFIRHSDMDVRVSVVSCISEIIRILAPDDPYEEEQMMKFFQVAVSAFESLSNMSGRAYTKAVSILSTIAISHSCVLMLDIRMHDLIHQMFRTFFNVIRASHPDAIFSDMEKIMTLIIHMDVDCDESAVELAKILLSNLKKENQNASPVAFRLAENTFKKCSDDLKEFLPKARQFLGLHVEDYAEVAASFFRDQDMDSENKNDVTDTSCHGEASLPIDDGLSSVAQDNETEKTGDLEINQNLHENRETSSQICDELDILGSPEQQQQEMLTENIPIRGKRSRKRNSLFKFEEGYNPFWLSSSCATKNYNCGSGSKKRKPSGHPQNDIIEANRRGKNTVFEDLEGDIINKNNLENRHESSGRKGKGKMVVFEDETKDDLTEDSENDVIDTSCHGEASLPIDDGLSSIAEDNETEKTGDLEINQNLHENRETSSQSCDELDILGSPEQQQEMLRENIPIRGKRSRKKNSLFKFEEGYNPFWLSSSCAAMKNYNCGSKKRKRSGHPQKDIIEANHRGKNTVFVDLEGDITTKNNLENRPESSDRKGKGKMVVFEDETKDDLTEESENDVKDTSCHGEASLPIDDGLSSIAEDNETEKTGDLEINQNLHENREISSQSCDEFDILGSPEQQQKMLKENIPIRGKRSRKKNSLIKFEEGYDPFWLSSSCAATKNYNCGSKKRKRSGHQQKDIIEANRRGKNTVFEDLEGDITTKASEVRDVGNCSGDDLVGRRVKVWWPLDQMFYEGEITFFDHLNKRHKVTYDDGEIESLDLVKECWLLVDGNTLSP